MHLTVSQDPKATESGLPPENANVRLKHLIINNKETF